MYMCILYMSDIDKHMKLSNNIFISKCRHFSQHFFIQVRLFRSPAKSPHPPGQIAPPVGRFGRFENFYELYDYYYM